MRGNRIAWTVADLENPPWHGGGEHGRALGPRRVANGILDGRRRCEPEFEGLAFHVDERHVPVTCHRTTGPGLDRTLDVAVGQPDGGRSVEPPAAGPRPLARGSISAAAAASHAASGWGDWAGQVELRQGIGPDLAVGEGRLLDQPAEEAQVRPDAQEPCLGQRGLQSVHGHLPRPSVGDDLGQQRVVSVRDQVSGPDAGIHPDALAARPAQVHHSTGRRQEPVLRILGVETGLDRVTGEPDRILCDSQRFAGRDPQLVGDQVTPGDRLGDRVLDLEAGVHLEEVERKVIGQQELDRPGAHVARRAGHPQRRLPERRPTLGVHRRAGRLLHDLLLAPLGAAVALAKLDTVAVGVEQDLDLDMAGAGQQALEDEPIVAEGGCSPRVGWRPGHRPAPPRSGRCACPCHHRHLLASRGLGSRSSARLR